jgi:hypothetical protein
VFSVIVIYIPGGIKRSNKTKGSVGLILEKILIFGSRWYPGLKGSN